MKQYIAVQIYKELTDGDCVEKGLLKEPLGLPAIFETPEIAANYALIAVKALNDNTLATWGFRLVEGKVL